MNVKAAAPTRPGRNALLGALSPVIELGKEPLVYGPAIRGFIGLALPLALGLITGHVAEGVLASLGGLWAVTQDGSGPVRSRITRIGVAVVASALGLTFGQVAYRTDSIQIVVAAGVVAAVVSGLIATAGPVGSTAGLYLLLGSIVGGGMHLPGPLYVPGTLLLVGGGLVCALSSASGKRDRERSLHLTLTKAYEASVAALLSVGTASAPKRKNELLAARHRLHDLVTDIAAEASQRPAAGASRAGERIQRLLTAAAIYDEVVDVVVVALHDAKPLDSSTVVLPLHIAHRLGIAKRQRSQIVSPGGESPAQCAHARLHGILNDLSTSRRFQSPQRTAITRPVRSQVPWRNRACMAGVFGASIAAAYVIAFALNSPRPYWVPLGVAFILKPELGPLFARAINRCIGTLLGALLSSAIAPLLGNGYAAVFTIGALGAGVALGVAYHYALGTLALTAVVFVFLPFLGDHRALFDSRILDTLIAAGVVLLAASLMRGDSWRSRVGRSLTAAVRATRAYEEAATNHQHPADDENTAKLGKAAYRRLAEAKTTMTRARQEPPFILKPHWDALLTDAELRCDQATAALQEAMLSSRRRGAG